MNVLLRLSAAVAASFAVLAAIGCSSHVVGGGGSGGTGGSSTSCPPPNPGMCAPTPCIGGLQRTGQAECQDGAWVCTEEACAPCAGPSVEACIDGQISTVCCAGACPYSDYCELGDGTCLVGPCPDYDAGPPCTGLVDAGHYDQSCVTDADCTAVYSGSLCGDCFCPNSAINKNALPAYASDVAAAHPQVGVCDCPAAPPVGCYGGFCSLPLGI